MTCNSADITNPVSDDAPKVGICGRLRVRRDFLHVQHKGVRQVMPHFILQAAEVGRPASMQPAAGYRTGVTASKKVGNAVARNHAKRRMRALFCQLSPEQSPASTDYVLVARHSLVHARWADLCADFAKAANRIHKKLNKTAT